MSALARHVPCDDRLADVYYSYDSKMRKSDRSDSFLNMHQPNVSPTEPTILRLRNHTLTSYLGPSKPMTVLPHTSSTHPTPHLTGISRHTLLQYPKMLNSPLWTSTRLRLAQELSHTLQNLSSTALHPSQAHNWFVHDYDFVSNARHFTTTVSGFAEEISDATM
jgi:hypothetical protein